MNKVFNPVETLLNSADLNNTGYLEFVAESLSWRVYLQSGKLKYVECSLQSLSQLKYYLLRQEWNAPVVALKDLPQSYFKAEADPENKSFNNGFYQQVIPWLLAEKHLYHSQFLQLIEDITQDSLESCLWLREGVVSWHEGELIPSWLQAETNDSLSFDIPDLVNFLEERLKKWQSCGSELTSPHQRPYFLDYRDIDKVPTWGVLSQKVLLKLANIMRKGLSFRQLSIVLQKDEIHVAQLLSPYIEHHKIHLRNPQSPLDRLPTIPPAPSREEVASPVPEPEVLKHKVVCIDDSPTILNEIQRFLDQERFEVTAISDPVKASSIIFRLEPDLILLDITMPRINGYKLCGLLRSSQVFDETPIIMVTGNTGMIDKARAKLAGATDYFTKPFTQESLMTIIEKHLN
ncbi:response regulator containing a CheY-like receiver domain and a GGDEF domain [Xenococcus sp. PCC 7305]|uniref:response regulator n=1 Tax=Xenococcus sp. PCC 7305 TaxID=102125 RepID=UPI0002ACA0C5|nr:response regulator [Xenococcus sp. PCC 7305]ELS03841.1 response regulator containing a CheY-like receiver domain and a GGDEF domain [Xenococcus sp. PCC 7305]